jgi:hypothetical protein
MGVISEALRDGVVGGSIRATNNKQTTVAVVTKTDEDNNLCSIKYIDTNGSAAEITKAAVDLRNKDWFPEVKEAVLVEVSGKNNALILSKYTEDYNKDIRSKRKLSNDVSADSDNTCCGQIF